MKVGIIGAGTMGQGIAKAFASVDGGENVAGDGELRVSAEFRQVIRGRLALDVWASRQNEFRDLAIGKPVVQFTDAERLGTDAGER